MPEEFFKPDEKIGEGENAQKAMHAGLMSDAASNFSPLLADKDWVLLKTTPSAPFLVGDHPLTMANQVDHAPRGNLGLAVTGIELYFPLTPTLALAMWCRSIQENLLKKFRQLDRLVDVAPNVAAQYIDAWKDGITIVEAIQRGTPLESQPDNVTYFNSLQIAFAERFLFSCNGDFSLAEEMIRDNAAFRHGRRLEEATGKF